MSNARLGPIDLSLAHGILLTGGSDVSAEFHPEPPADPGMIRELEPERDAWEFEAVRQATERGLPLLCICKGVQVFNVALHQALDRTADALEVEAWHAGDGTIEQVRLRDHPWGLGVQYHPERDPIDALLFEEFFALLKP